MSSIPEYSIIIPTYNERENIPIILYLIDKYLKKNNVNFEVVIVDDNSPDNTQEAVRMLQKFYSNTKIKLLGREGKLGLGTAYVAGAKLCEGDYIILMDADLSHHPKYILEYIKKQKETKCDIVTGTRYSNGGGVYGWDVIRKIISRGANFFASFFLNPSITDLTGSFRLYKKDLFFKLIEQVKNSGYAFQMEMIIRVKNIFIKAQYLGYKIEQVPISFVDRFFGSSKLGFKEIVIYFKTVLTLYSEL